MNLRPYRRKIYSQNGEDGILLRILKLCKPCSITKFFFEFGVEDGSECNTRILRKTWKGIILDGSNENKSINLYKEFITANNISNLILLYKIPKNLGIFVIDIDYNDAYVAFKTLTQLSPSIVIATVLSDENAPMFNVYPSEQDGGLLTLLNGFNTLVDTL